MLQYIRPRRCGQPPDQQQNRRRYADGYRGDQRSLHAVERMDTQRLQHGSGRIVRRKDNGAEQVGEYPAETGKRIEKIEQKSAAGDQPQNRKRENGIPKNIMSFGKMKGVPFTFLPSHKADHILERSQRTDGRTVDAAEKNGEDHDHDESGRAESRCVREL